MPPAFFFFYPGRPRLEFFSLSVSHSSEVASSGKKTRCEEKLTMVRVPLGQSNQRFPLGSQTLLPEAKEMRVSMAGGDLNSTQYMESSQQYLSAYLPESVSLNQACELVQSSDISLHPFTLAKCYS